MTWFDARVRGISRAARRGDDGQGSLELVGLVVVIGALVAAVVTAFVANTPTVGRDVARAVCSFITLGGCGSETEVQTREPTAPCVVQGSSDTINAGIDFTVVSVGGSRSMGWEELSDGRFRLTQRSGGDVQGTTGVGAKVGFTVADTEVGFGADAGISGGATFSGGQEWVVDSVAERDRLLSAENWERFDAVAGATSPLGSGVVGWGRDALGIGEQLPPPDRVFVEGGLVAEGSAYVGASGVATANAGVATSRVLGYSYEPDGDGDRTFYFETKESGDALAGVIDLGGMQGASLEGEVTTLTSITVDDSGQVVKASRSGLATGTSAGLTNALFGGEFSTSTNDSVGTGTQYDATLEVRTDADRQAVASLLASAGIEAADIGATPLAPGASALLEQPFLAAVRDRGDLTRTGVVADSSTVAALDAAVKAGAVAGVNASYGTSSMEYADPEYYDGTAYVPRTNC